MVPGKNKILIERYKVLFKSVMTSICLRVFEKYLFKPSNKLIDKANWRLLFKKYQVCLHVLMFFLLSVSPASAAIRVALVIGNATYSSVPLTNPLNDAAAMSKQLASAGYKVKEFHDLTQSAMYDAVDSFFSDYRNAEELIIFYAGHAIQVNGRNYLIPVDAMFDSEDILSRLFDIHYIMEMLTTLKSARAKVVILDACRNNPFSTHPLASSGLAEISAPVGTIIAFSTAPGMTAEDGEEINSPYVTQLLQAIAIPGKKIEDIFKEVRKNVKASTKGRQIPWEATSLEADFYFIPPIIKSDQSVKSTSKTSRSDKTKSALVKNRCDQILMKISLGMEVLSSEEQSLLQSDCR